MIRCSIFVPTALLLACGIVCGQEPTNPNADKLNCFKPFIGVWRFDGPILEEVPGIAERGTGCLIEFSWKRILNKGAIEAGLRVEIEGKGGLYSDKMLIAWNASEQQISLAGTSTSGDIFLGTVEPDQEAKRLTVSWKGVTNDGTSTSSKGVFTMTDRNTLTFEALERKGPIVQGSSPVYTLTRVRRQETTTTAECPWKFLTGHWRLTDATGGESHVVWKESDGNSLIGMWKDATGKATELCGWRPERGELVATGYGENGEYWEVRFTTVTETMVKGPMVDRSSDGSVRRGTFQITKKSEDEMSTLFEGTLDGEQVSIEGSFTRVK